MSINKNDLKIGHHYLLESDDNGVIALKELTLKEFNSAIAASEWLHKYHYHKRREMEVNLNLESFFEKYSFYQTNGLNGNYNKRSDFFVKAYVDLNRVLTNFSSSFRLLIDNLEIFFKKEHGETSKEYLAFKRIITNEFNSKFEYRLFYALRNYSQHKNFPIGSVGVDNEVDKRTRRRKSDFTVDFNRDKFLKEDRRNFRHIESDLMRMNKLFPVLPQMDKIKKSLKIIGKAITDIEKSIVVKKTNTLLRYYSFREIDGDLGFAKLKIDRGSGMFDSIEIPINILREIYREIEDKELGL